MTTPQRLRGLSYQLRRQYPRPGTGFHIGGRTGRGTMPLPSREWRPGDTTRRIDWRLTVQQLKTFVRQRANQYDARVLMVVDLDTALVWGGAEAIELKSTLARQTAIALTQLLADNGDQVGCLITGETEEFRPLARGDEAVQQLRRALDQASPARSGTLGKALDGLAARDVQVELIVVVSDFLGDGWQKPLQQLAIKRDVAVVQLLDPWDLELPDIGTVTLCDPSGQSYRLKTGSRRVREQYAQAAREIHDGVKATMRRAKALHIVVDTSLPLIDQLARGLRPQAR